MTNDTPTTTAPSRGGRRRGAGRPPRHGERLVDGHVRLLPQEWARLREIGEGDCAEGVRRLLAGLTSPIATAPHLNTGAKPPPPVDAPLNTPPLITPRPQPPRPASPAVSGDLYRTVRAVPKSYSARSAQRETASPRHTPAASPTPAKDHGADQGEHEWWH